MNERAPLTARANVLQGERDELRARLAREGVGAEPTRFSPWGLVLDGRENAFALASFKEGRFEIQDEGSQLIALACGARAGFTVVDACAGAGGKALALAAEMHNKGSLHALDSDAERLDEARRRARRAGVHNLRARPIAPGPEAEAQLQDLARFAALQRDLVRRFAALVRPGGRLVYATCSVGPTENDEVADFAAREVGLRPAPIAPFLGEERARALALGADEARLTLMPHRHGTDGFFVASFDKAK